MTDPSLITISIITASISVLALAISAITAWLTLFKRGTVKMSQPTVIFFGSESSKSRNDEPLPKVFLRTLLFSTSKRGRVVESMHVALSRNETHQNFNIWVYGDDKLVRGSGLFVGENGIAANHHFLTPKDGSTFRFTEGRYHIEVFAHLLGDKCRTLLFSQTLEVTSDIATQLEDLSTGLYFDWGPDSSRYISHVDKRAPSPEPEEFLELLGLTQNSSKRTTKTRNS
jgi:hypothetical protein